MTSEDMIIINTDRHIVTCKIIIVTARAISDTMMVSEILADVVTAPPPGGPVYYHNSRWTSILSQLQVDQYIITV